MSTIALVTGASRGLGLETARRLGRRDGYKVIVGARDATGGERAVAALLDDGIDAEMVVLDVTSPASVEAAGGTVEERHGRLDVLVNNAGILPEATEGTGNGPVDVDMFRRTFDTNVFGAVAVSQRFLPLLRRSPAGRIVNVSSTMGSLDDQLDPESPYYGVVVPAYQGSKAALNAFTIALSKTLADTAIKVNSVCPGWLQTGLGGPDNRAAAPTTAADGAEIVVEMACLAEDGPTGSFVDRDGSVAW
ncbi:MAG TPA: SDR family oxidoreductase [Solirubrobacteraceae bacterium]|nr:SDR family oxidoreductase [Solirubrobacteraceae bacterium]